MDRYVLIGLDGCGKSANLNKMKCDLRFDGFSFTWVRWEPKLLRPLYRFIHKQTKQKEPAKDHETLPQDDTVEAAVHYSKKQQLKKRLFSLPLVGRLWIFAALIDYLIQFYIKYAQLKKSAKNIVFDRYYYDLFVDQGLNIGYTPEQIVQLIRTHAFLFPGIKKTIYIKVDPAVCISRKDDIPSMDYLLPRYAVYELLSRELAWEIIDGEMSLEEVYASIRTSILDY